MQRFQIVSKLNRGFGLTRLQSKRILLDFLYVFSRSGVLCDHISWWRNQMGTFSCHWSLWGESTGHRWIPLTQMPVTRILYVFFDLRLNKGWANNRNIGDLGRDRAHFDVTIMFRVKSGICGNYPLWYCDVCLSDHARMQSRNQNLLFMLLISVMIWRYLSVLLTFSSLGVLNRINW